MTTKNLIPRASGEGGIGITDVTWGYGYYDTGNFNKGLFVSGHNITQVIAETVTQGGLGGEWTRNGLDIYYNGGNVGIGTTSPDQKLEIFGGALKFGTNAAGLNEFELFPTDEGSNGLGFYDRTNSAYRMLISNAGNVGIGTTDPSAKLDLQLSAGHPFYIRSGSGANDNLFLFEAPAAGPQLRMYEVGTSNVKVKISTHDDSYFNGGNVGIGTTNPAEKLDVRGSINLRSGFNLTWDNNGLIAASATNMQFYVAGGELMRITSAGNVGIGTPNPTSKLHIFDSSISNNDFLGLVLSNYDYGIGETGQSVSIEGRVRNDTGGDNGVGKITFGKDSDFSTVDNRDGNISFHTMFGNNGTAVFTERMRINALGNVGIGTTNPDGKLEVKGGFSYLEGLSLKPASGTVSEINSGSNTYDLSIKNGAWEALMIKAGGNVGIGTASPFAKLGVELPVNIDLTTGLFVRNNSSHSGSGGSNIASFHGPNDYVMQVKCNGNVGIGTTNPTSNLQVISDGGSTCTMNRNSTDGHILRFEKNGVLVGSISTNSNSLPSDKNFKRNISELELGLDFVNKLKPSVYNYKIDDEGCPVHYGLIAQDVESTLEECGVEKNSSLMLQYSPTEKEEESDYSLDYGKLIPVLTKAIQEQQQLIEDLRSEVEALKNK